MKVLRLSRALLLGPLALMLLLLVCGQATALINPNYTPVDLVRGAQTVLHLELGPIADEGLPVKLIASVKGQAAEAPRFDLDESGAHVVEMLGEYLPEDEGVVTAAFVVMKPAEGQEADSGYLQVGTKWFQLSLGADGAWVIAPDAADMKAVWAGSGEMLLRAARYIEKTAKPYMPVAANATWRGVVEVGSASGDVNGALILSSSAGLPTLLVLSTEGDRAFRWNPEAVAFGDVTEAIGIVTRSMAAAFSPIDPEPGVDLVTWDGEILSVSPALPEGSFGEPAMRIPVDDCIGLSAGAVGTRAAVVVSRAEAPAVLVGKDAGLELVPLTLPEGALELGAASPCVAADYDGDGWLDILQPRLDGGVLFKGAADGSFTASIVEGMPLAGEPDSFCAPADFDADGRIDVLVAGKDGLFFWDNRADGVFVEALLDSGEPEYIAKQGNSGLTVADLNHDGLMDFAVAYERAGLHVFFNRGFRTFGYAASLGPVDTSLLPAAGDGQQTTIAGDLDSDGAVDLVMVLNDGTVQAMMSNAPDEMLCLNLQPGRGLSVPVAVKVAATEYSLGAWQLTPGAAGPAIGVRSPGAFVLTWRLPGQEAQTKKVFVEFEPVSVTIGPGGAGVKEGLR